MPTRSGRARAHAFHGGGGGQRSEEEGCREAGGATKVGPGSHGRMAVVMARRGSGGQGQEAGSEGLGCAGDEERPMAWLSGIRCHKCMVMMMGGGSSAVFEVSPTQVVATVLRVRCRAKGVFQMTDGR